jgi:hypothetical protein
MLKFMKLKTLFFCASIGFSCHHQTNPRQIFGTCLLDHQRNEIVHTDIQNFFRQPIPPNLDLRFPIRCTYQSAFFISSDGFLHGIHASSNSASPFDLFMTQSDLRCVFPTLSNYAVSQNGEIILEFNDGSTRRFSLILH